MAKSGLPLIDAQTPMAVTCAPETMATSKFMTIMVLALALVLGTRWCIVTFYSTTYVSTDPRGLAGKVQLSAPTRQLFQEEEAALASTLAPQFQAVHASHVR